MLIAGAAAIPGIMPMNAHAIGPAKEAEAQFSYMSYRDWQAGDPGNRIRVNAPMAWFKAPVAEKTEIEGTFVLDTISGASPLYHSTLSGASGVGIEDKRKSVDLSLTQYFEKFSITVGGSYSTEDDYDSTGGSVEVRYWTPDNNTIFSLGGGTSHDVIGSTNDPTLDETRRTDGVGAGVTQIVDETTMVQSNVTASFANGYLSDPYKTFDLRPRSRDQWAWLTRYVHYVPSQDASLHLDYRLYHDSWDITAHTFEVAWYQPLGEKWLVRPRLRYYSQGKAEFYHDYFPPDDPGSNFYSADQRLGGFGSFTPGFRVERELAPKARAHLAVDYMQQRGAFRLGSPGSPGLETFSAIFFGLGVDFKF